MRLLQELYCVIVIKDVAFFTVCAKLTMAFTLTSLPLTFTRLFPDVVVVSDFNKNFGGWTDLAKKRHGSADLHTPIRHPHLVLLDFFVGHTSRCKLFQAI